MDNWKIVNKIAIAFGIIFSIFSAVAGIVNYKLDTTLYSSAAPEIFIALTVVTAMLPFIVSAVLSFAVAALTSKPAKLVAELEPEMQTEAHVPETPP
jgi:magnesium-transporting ATPase (P-type)